MKSVCLRSVAFILKGKGCLLTCLHTTNQSKNWVRTVNIWSLFVSYEQQKRKFRQKLWQGGGEGTIITSLWLFEVASGPVPTYSKYRLSACLLASHHSKATFMEALPPSQRAIGSTRFPSLVTQYCVNPGENDLNMSLNKLRVKMSAHMSLRHDNTALSEMFAPWQEAPIVLCLSAFLL